jgi:hypothetical protein
VYSNAADCVPLGDVTVAVPPIFSKAKPGRLSTVCCPGIKRIVVFSTSSLLFPLKYENLAASIIALCRVLKGCAREFP